ncbi:MAG: hypothetical protein ACTS44_01010 [Candidatus Hodgkinia cicadicola]
MIPTNLKTNSINQRNKRFRFILISLLPLFGSQTTIRRINRKLFLRWTELSADG